MANATMTKEQEETTLTHHGTYNWQDISELDPQPVGMKLVRLNENMWSKSGWKYNKKEEKYDREINVIFDKQYVLDWLHTRFFIPMGISKNGEFNEELLQEILKEAKAYSLAEEEREQEREMMRLARTFIEERGWSKEQALKAVKRQRQLMQQIVLEIEAEGSVED